MIIVTYSGKDGYLTKANVSENLVITYKADGTQEVFLKVPWKLSKHMMNKLRNDTEKTVSK